MKCQCVISKAAWEFEFEYFMNIELNISRIEQHKFSQQKDLKNIIV